MARRSERPDHRPPAAVRAAVAPHPTRRRRAAIFQAYVIIATALFLALAVAAHYVPYFGIDLKITRALQGQQSTLLDALMRGLTWIGFYPQVYILFALFVALLFALGLHWEAVAAGFAAFGTVVGSVIKI